MLDTLKIYSTKNYGKLKVVSYIDCQHVEVEFLDTGFKALRPAADIKKGSVKDLLRPYVAGVGYLGVGRYRSREEGRITKQYRAWSAMIERCYSPKFQARCPTYTGCSVAIEWHNFQRFASWYDENHVNGLELDKDIKVKGNKIYSSKTCLFVTRRDNVVDAHAKRYVFISPSGEKVDVYNLSEFCRRNNLTNSNMAALCSGKQRTHKQWKLYEEEAKRNA